MFTSAENETDLRCMLFDGNEYKCNVIIGLRKAAAAFSLVGCLFMIIVIWLFGKYTLFAQRLILYLTIAAFFGSTSYLIQTDRPDGPICDFEAFWVTLWDWVVLSWTCCIVFNVAISLIKMTSTGKYEIIYHFVAWGIPLVLSSLPFIGDHYGPAGAWCWIADDTGDATYWRFSIWYGPLFILIFVMLVTYIFVLFKLKKMIGVYHGPDVLPQQVEQERKLLKKEIQPLVAYPLVYLILSIFGLINRIQNAIYPDHPVFVLYLLQSITSPLVGAANAIVYGLDRHTRKKFNRKSIKNAVRKKRQVSEGGKIQEYNPPTDNETDRNDVASNEQEDKPKENTEA